ncbi:MAG: magnesium/cobalt transporter CorA [Gammaproteobacteria bacterium]
MNMIVNCAAYAKGQRIIADLAIDEIADVLAQEDAFVWLGLDEPNEELMRRVQDQFKFHDLAVEDAHTAHQRPKIEVYGDSLFIVLRTAQLLEGTIRFGETHIFVGLRYIVTVRHGASLPYRPVRERCESSPELLRRGPAFALYAIMDYVVDNFFPIVDGFDELVEDLDESIIREPLSRLNTARIYELRRDLVQLRRAVAPLVEVCNALVDQRFQPIPDDIRPYFRDVYDQVLKILEVIDGAREMITAALQVNLSLTTLNQNEVMKRLAGWGALLAVPTMIFSVYGMNFRFMPELDWRYGYAAVLGVVAVVCTALYRRLKRAGWL